LALDNARSGDAPVIRKLDRIGRSLSHVVGFVGELQKQGIGLKVLTGDVDRDDGDGTSGLRIFATLAEFGNELIRERTMAVLQAARARGRTGVRKFALTKAYVRLAPAAMANPDISVAELCKQLKIHPVSTRYVDPNGNLRDGEKRVLGA